LLKKKYKQNLSIRLKEISIRFSINFANSFGKRLARNKEETQEATFLPLQTQYLYFALAPSSHSGRSALCAAASQSDHSKLMSRANREKKSLSSPPNADFAAHTQNKQFSISHAQPQQPLSRARYLAAGARKS
jgi:hypothetical protein